MSKLLFTIPLLFLLVFISGCAQQEAGGVTGGATAGAAMQGFLDNVIAGNYESAINQMINFKGESPSADVKDDLISNWEANLISSYQIISESDVSATELAEIFRQFPDSAETAEALFSEWKQVTITFEIQQQPDIGTVGAPYLVVKHEGEWKIIFFN